MAAISSLLQYHVQRLPYISMINSLWRTWCWMQRANNNSYLGGYCIHQPNCTFICSYLQNVLNIYIFSILLFKIGAINQTHSHIPGILNPSNTWTKPLGWVHSMLVTAVDYLWDITMFHSLIYSLHYHFVDVSSLNWWTSFTIREWVIVRR